jgi:hypothetical protein
METRDRRWNLALFGAAAVAWVLVGWVVLTRDPRLEPTFGVVGAALMGLAIGVTSVPLFWLAVFSRHRRIAYRGDWTRALRRGGWVGLIVAAFVLLRLQGSFQPQFALFIVAIVLVAETTLSAER